MVTAEELVTEMHLQYRIMGQNAGKLGDDDDVVETALSNFQGTCYHCGKSGHQKADCHLKKMEMVTETTKPIIIIVGTAKETENSKDSATTVGLERRLLLFTAVILQ